ncbi:MAG: ATP-binding protein [Chitinispirillales bacterium]|jgi:anti-sigma regulatory factor (Ser/Thr protein kinase)|nr:ATP-binding protein [Chitinispirillales bacterium]
MDELIIDAKVDNLDTVVSFVAEKLELVGCPMKLQAQITMAVEEVFVNIAHYAYHPEVGGAVVRVCVNGDVTIEFEDKGKPYNPLDKDDPNITATAKEREVGGLGIYLVKRLMDSVEYRRGDNKNILTMKKKVAWR